MLEEEKRNYAEAGGKVDDEVSGRVGCAVGIIKGLGVRMLRKE